MNDVDPVRTQQEALFEQYTPLALKLAGQYFKPQRGQSFDDYRQVALIALWRAIELWRPERGALTTYATNCIIGSIKREEWKQSFWGLRSARIHGRGGYRQGNSHTGEMTILLRPTLLSFSVGLHDRQINSTHNNTCELVDFIISRICSPMQQNLARRHWVEGLHIKIIAHQMGMSYSACLRLARHTMEEMQIIAEKFNLSEEWER